MIHNKCVITIRITSSVDQIELIRNGKVLEDLITTTDANFDVKVSSNYIFFLGQRERRYKFQFRGGRIGDGSEVERGGKRVEGLTRFLNRRKFFT